MTDSTKGIRDRIDQGQICDLGVLHVLPHIDSYFEESCRNAVAGCKPSQERKFCLYTNYESCV